MVCRFCCKRLFRICRASTLTPQISLGSGDSLQTDFITFDPPSFIASLTKRQVSTPLRLIKGVVEHCPRRDCQNEKGLQSSHKKTDSRNPLSRAPVRLPGKKSGKTTHNTEGYPDQEEEIGQTV